MYEKLNKVYNETRLDLFCMAVGYVIDKGVEYVSQFEDKDIDELKGTPMMTDGFVQSLVRTARDIAKATNTGIELVQFCDAKGVFEVEHYTNGEKYGRTTLEEIARKTFEYILYDETDFPNSEEEAKENLADYLGIEVEDIEKLMEY